MHFANNTNFNGRISNLCTKDSILASHWGQVNFQYACGEQDLRRIESSPFHLGDLIFKPKKFFLENPTFHLRFIFVFLADIYLIFSRLVFCDSFSFLVRNNTTCTHNVKF